MLPYASTTWVKVGFVRTTVFSQSSGIPSITIWEYDPRLRSKPPSSRGMNLNLLLNFMKFLFIIMLV